MFKYKWKFAIRNWFPRFFTLHCKMAQRVTGGIWTHDLLAIVPTKPGQIKHYTLIKLIAPKIISWFWCMKLAMWPWTSNQSTLVQHSNSKICSWIQLMVEIENSFSCSKFRNNLQYYQSRHINIVHCLLLTK